MLIVNDDHLRLAGIVSLEERCTYCSKTLAAYPLIMSDDAKQRVYHITCALELATDIMVDLDTFFSPPAPYVRLFTLTADHPEGGGDAVNGSVRHDVACVKWSTLGSQPSVQGCLQSLSASLVTVGWKARGNV